MLPYFNNTCRFFVRYYSFFRTRYQSIINMIPSETIRQHLAKNRIFKFSNLLTFFNYNHIKHLKYCGLYYIFRPKLVWNLFIWLNCPPLLYQASFLRNTFVQRLFVLVPICPEPICPKTYQFIMKIAEEVGFSKIADNFYHKIVGTNMLMYFIKFLQTKLK